MRCIYCLQPSHHAKGVAHVFPEALVQNNIVLPRGAVCDPCNNYLGKLDNAIIAHNHIWPMIQLLGLPGKGGRQRRRLGFMERGSAEAPWTLRVQRRDIAKLTFGPKGLHAEIGNPQEFDELKFRRALHHMAFNVLAYLTSVDFVLLNAFDDVRRYIRRPKIGEKWPYSQVIGSPTRNIIEARRLAKEPGEAIVLRIFCDEFYVDLLNSGRGMSI